METIKKEDFYPAAFYKESGLRFQCQRCSGCCRFFPGYVFLSFEDLADLMAATGLRLTQLQNAFLRIVPIGGFAQLSLKEKENYDCIFWENGGCRVYDHRPLQCRSFPFWQALLSSQSAWEEQKKSCPGIGRGPIHSTGEIDECLKKRRNERFIEIDMDKECNLEDLFRDFLQKAQLRQSKNIEG